VLNRELNKEIIEPIMDLQCHSESEEYSYDENDETNESEKNRNLLLNETLSHRDTGEKEVSI
jgi:hypothetical protein